MNFLRGFASTLLFGTAMAGVLKADNVNHFRGFPPPPDEARILALTGVREFCAHYEVMPTVTPAQQNRPGSQNNYQQDLNFFAEVYSGTTCTARYRLAFAVNAFDDLSKPLTGLISVGWNEEQHELTSVVDNRQFYSPWSARIHLPAFEAVDAHYFEDAKGEKRHSEQSGDFVIYPVLGICGDRIFKIPGGYEGINDAARFLKICQFVKSQECRNPLRLSHGRGRRALEVRSASLIFHAPARHFRLRRRFAFEIAEAACVAADAGTASGR